jgi:hypothetical protein
MILYFRVWVFGPNLGSLNKGILEVIKNFDSILEFRTIWKLLEGFF